jgi:hypothetical protein
VEGGGRRESSMRERVLPEQRRRGSQPRLS